MVSETGVRDPCCHVMLMFSFKNRHNENIQKNDNLFTLETQKLSSRKCLSAE